jgi:sporadic carbohydrate cluster 2OG-Fe(II) oxygenase
MRDPNSFWSQDELDLTEKYLNQGYLITEVEDRTALKKIQRFVAITTAEYLGKTVDSEEIFLNDTHRLIRPEKLNPMRLHLMNSMNAQPWFRTQYYSLARNLLSTIVGNELAMQLRVNLSIQLPDDSSSLLPVHADVWSGDSPFEAVIWLPLVACYATKSMFLLPQNKSSEEIFKYVEPDLVWLELSYGEVLLFNQNLPHGNRINEETETRWSMNCRFKSVFSPYGDKKLGEFFEPIIIRPATSIGISYKSPTIE